MTLALSDMSRDALVRELRVAIARGDRDRGKRIKRELARRRNIKGSETPRMVPPLKHWADRD